MICTGCNIEKVETDFYLYKEKNGQVKRRRRCIDCLIAAASARKKKNKKPKELKPVIVKIAAPIVEKKKRGRPRIYPISNQIDSKVVKLKDNTKIVSTYQNEKRGSKFVPNDFIQCTKCFEIKPAEEFYIQNKKNGRRQRRCKPCYNAQSNERARKKGWDNLDYRTEPNEWISNEQRDIVHQILKNLGWSYNSEKEIWYKHLHNRMNIYKNEEGEWVNIKPIKKVEILPKINYRTGRGELKLDMHRIIELRNENVPFKAIAAEMNCTPETIKNRIKKYKQQCQGS